MRVVFRSAASRYAHHQDPIQRGHHLASLLKSCFRKRTTRIAHISICTHERTVKCWERPGEWSDRGARYLPPEEDRQPVPVLQVVEDPFECHMRNARHLGNVPGRKTEVADAAWMCHLVEHLLVHPSFLPPKPFRELRNLTRYRKTQIEERTREAQRLDKILQDAGVKLSSVASDICGSRDGHDACPCGEDPRPRRAPRAR